MFCYLVFNSYINMSNTKLINRIIFITVKVLGIFLLAVAILFFINSFYLLQRYINLGRVGIEHDWNEKAGAVVIYKVEKNSAASRAGLKPGDVIREVNDKKLNKKNWEALEIWGQSVPDTRLVLKIQRGNEILRFEMTRQLTSLFERIEGILLNIIPPLIMIAYIIVGLWGIFKSSPSVETILISLFCYTLGTFMYEHVAYGFPSPLNQFFNLDEIKNRFGYFIAFFPSFWLNLFVRFPQEIAVYKKYKWQVLSIIYALPVAFIALYLTKTLNNYIVLAVLIVSFIYIFSGVSILSRGASQSTDALKKRQFRLMLFGLKFGSISFAVGVASRFIGANMGLRWMPFSYWVYDLLFTVGQIGSLVIPFTFYNSFLSEKILETESALRRKLIYLSTTLILFVLYLSLVLFIGNALIASLQLRDNSLLIVLVMLVATTFSPINKRIDNFLENYLYPEKTKYRLSLLELVKRIPGLVETQAVLETVSQWIERTMGITPIQAIALDSVTGKKIPLHIGEGSTVLNRLKKGSIFFWDEHAETDSVQKDEKEWAMRQGISMTVPMISRGELVGLLNVGKKQNYEDFNGGDLEIIQEAADQTALALQNINLQLESYQKKRMDQEMEVARKIQMHLMPQSIPDVKGLLLHGESRSCFEVGGDYYDILMTDEDKAVLAIADVSGKGAGAALLMANLQASLRFAIKLNHRLPETVYEINNTLHQNTSAEQFITFFVGLWDYSSRTLRYINAGHNPPILIKKDGRMSRLDSTGMVLGVLPNQNFIEAEVQIAPDDVLAIYTDGIVEVTNKNLQEFGLERLMQFMVANRQLCPEEIAHSLMDQIKGFCSGATLSDDCTMIIVKGAAS